MNKFYKAGLLLTTAGLLAACSSGGGADVAEETQGGEPKATLSEGDIPEKPEKLQMWVNNEDAQIEAYEEITKKFTEETGIEVEMTPYDMLEQTEGMSLDGPSGQGADLFFQPHDRVGDVYHQGLAAELEFTDEQLAKLEEYNEDAVGSFNYEGAQMGIPAVVETYAMFINTDIVDKVPETAEDLLELAREKTEGDQYGFLADMQNLYFMYPFITSEGAYLFGQDDTGHYDASDIGLNTPEAVSALEYYQTFFNEKLIPEGTDLEVAASLFQDGKVGAIIDGPWAIPQHREALGDKLQVIEMPKYNGEAMKTFAGNKGWLVNEYSENKYWATELALHLTSAESSQIYYEKAGELPAHKNVTIEDEFMQPIFEQTKNANPMPNIPEMGQVWDPMADAFTFIQKGESPQEILDETVEQIKADIQMMGQ